jgi:hypothetical protein
MISLKSRLQMIGEGHPHQAIPQIPHGFHSCPRSLKEAMHAMLSPRVSEWQLNSKEHEFDNEDWTEECDGVTTDGQHWFFCSSNKDLVAIYKFSSDFKHLGSALIPDTKHVGDIDFSNGLIFAPLDPRRIGIFDTSPKFLRFGNLDCAGEKAGHKGQLPWCAINPWNGFLYSSTFDNVDRVHAYDPSENFADPSKNFAYKGALHLQGPPVGGVQGGVFSPNGHLYLTSDVYEGKNATQDVRGYSALNGAYLGSCHVPYKSDSLDAEEMEGLTLWTGFPFGQVHVVILDNDALSDDDVYFKHFDVPDTSVL